MWKYYYENCCSDNVVATYTNDQGHKVLEVYEARGCFYTRSLYSFLDATIVDYKKADALANNMDENRSRLQRRLEAGSKLIEENYREQVKNIKRIIG